MCIVFFQTFSPPTLCNEGKDETTISVMAQRYKLILASNRDEFLTRPTRRPRFWEEVPYTNVLAGKDLRAGGVWMGATKKGRFGVLTNVRTPVEDSAARQERKSRGHLVLDFLGHADAGLLPAAYADSVVAADAPPDTGNGFAGYNLLVGDVTKEEMAYVSNKGDAARHVQVLQPNRLYAISNKLLDVPWGKLERGKALFSEILAETAATASTDDALAHLLLDRLLHDTEACAPATDTGYPLDFEAKLARICIPGVALWEEGDIDGVFGTTASIVVLVTRDDRLLFYERGLELDEATQTFVWSAVEKIESPLVT